jgi:hypothetical protein
MTALKTQMQKKKRYWSKSNKWQSLKIIQLYDLFERRVLLDPQYCPNKVNGLAGSGSIRKGSK